MIEAFKREKICCDVLAEMSHPELKELGVAAYGHRHRLIRAARKLTSGPKESMIHGTFRNPFFVEILCSFSSAKCCNIG